MRTLLRGLLVSTFVLAVGCGSNSTPPAPGGNSADPSALPESAKQVIHVSGSTTPGQADHVFNAGGVTYHLPIAQNSEDVNDGVRVATELLKAVRAKGIEWSDGKNRIEVVDGAVTVNGKPCGAVKSGDHARLTADGRFFVNDVERKAEGVP